MFFYCKLSCSCTRAIACTHKNLHLPTKTFWLQLGCHKLQIVMFTYKTFDIHRSMCFDLTSSFLIFRLGVDAGGYEDKGVESLRCNLSAFLSRDATMKAGLNVQIATVTALLGLLPLDFETLVQHNVKLQETATHSVLVDYIWKWFSLLSKEQQELSVSVLRTTGAKKKEL